MTAALAETIGSAVVKGRPVFIDAGEVRVPNMSDSVRHDPDFLEFYRTFGNYLSNLLLNDGTWPSWMLFARRIAAWLSCLIFAGFTGYPCAIKKLCKNIAFVT